MMLVDTLHVGTKWHELVILLRGWKHRYKGEQGGWLGDGVGFGSIRYPRRANSINTFIPAIRAGPETG